MMNDTKYAVIAAIDWQGGFSRHGEIPWYFKEDFQHFRKITMGNICVMGRKTYDDINARLGVRGEVDVLPGRKSIVLTSDRTTKITNAVVARSIQEVMDITFHESRTVFFIGGEQIFESGIDIADEVYLTIIPNDYQCDSFFPVAKIVNNFTIESETETDLGLTFIKLIRKSDDTTRGSKS